MKAIIKFPYKLQDLVIIECNKLFNNSDITVQPVNFSEVKQDFPTESIVLGLGKKDSKCENFLISQCKSFNNRDVEYLDFLRFENKITGTHCVRLKRSLNTLKKNLLDKFSKESQTGVFSLASIHRIVESYTGYEEDIEKEYLKKSTAINLWIKTLVSTEGPEFLTKDILEKSLNSIINSRFNLNNSTINEFYEADNPLGNYRISQNIKSDIKTLIERKTASIQSTNLFNLMNYNNCSQWLEMWLDSRVSESSTKNRYLELWNSCDFSKRYTVINTTGVLIPNWKELARGEGNVMFFITPEKGTENWSIITTVPSKFPLINTEGKAYWTHVSQFLAKFSTLDLAKDYLDSLIEEYNSSISDYLDN